MSGQTGLIAIDYSSLPLLHGLGDVRANSPPSGNSTQSAARREMTWIAVCETDTGAVSPSEKRY
jgi:hypothetical protein